MKKAPPRTIMLVEDHEDTRVAMAGWLRREGFNVIETPDREACLAAARQQPFDLLVCDLQLPDGDGWTLLEELSLPETVVAIATSGHCSPADLERSKRAGYLQHIIKPFPVSELAAALARAERKLATRKPVARSATRRKKRRRKPEA